MANTGFIRQNLDQMRNDAKALVDSFNASARKLNRFPDPLMNHIHQWAGSNTTDAKYASFTYGEIPAIAYSFGSEALATIPDDQLIKAFNKFELDYFGLTLEVFAMGQLQRNYLKLYNEHLHQWAGFATKLTTAFSEPNFFLDTIKIAETSPNSRRARRSQTLDQAQANIGGWQDELLELKKAAIITDYWITDFISMFNNHTHYWWPSYTTTPLTPISP